MTARKRWTRTIRLLHGGQITIPADFRRALGIGVGDELRASVEGEELRLRKLPTASEATGSPWLAELYRRFSPVRDEAITTG